MRETHCPICYEELEIREVAPCDDCGWDPVELEHFKEGKHKYDEYEVFPGLQLTLCDFCVLDFSSYKPDFFGLPKETKIGIQKMNFIRALRNPSRSQDKFCPNCKHRLSFLRFVRKARERHSTDIH